MRDLDNVKRGLDDLVEKATTPDGRLTSQGYAYNQLRTALLSKLDDMTTDPRTGASVYRNAREAFSRPSSLMDAANAGRRAVTSDEATIQSMVGGLDAAQTQAFRIGAFEALRAKLGTQGGQTQILNMWKEPTTREKLKVIFGDERSFREFASAAAREGVMKRVQSVGTGSQTAARQAGMGDIDNSALTDAASLLTNAKAGNVLGVVGTARNAWGRVATPQPVRDEMGRLLMMRGPQAQQELAQLAPLVNQINRNQAMLQTQLLAVPGSMIGSNVGPNINLGWLD
jgi:hypothetical protein